MEYVLLSEDADVLTPGLLVSFEGTVDDLLTASPDPVTSDPSRLDEAEGLFELFHLVLISLCLSRLPYATELLPLFPPV